MRSWIAEAGLAGHAAWVPAGRDERDPQRFWLSVLAALARTGPGGPLVRGVTAAPDLDGWSLVERLLEDLATLEERLWLVIDDVHELGSTEVLRQLELLVLRAPPPLRFVLATRHDVRLGLHRLRLEGDLAEIRAGDLRFSVDEAGELLRGAGVELTASALAALHERTEGWAAGLRLAALSLSAHPDPARLAAKFSGSERTVAEYLVAEVLERQSAPVRQLLLRTSVLERVNGELADLLTGNEGGERVLQDLEEANVFVVSVDPGRTWFRYHQLFADLLRLELRRSAAGEVVGLHRAAAGWFAAHGYAVEAIRHAQVAQDFDQAARLLADHWPGLRLDGQVATIHELLPGFPSGRVITDPELAVVTADDELSRGSFETAERYLELADRASASMPTSRYGHLRLLHGVVSLLLAFQSGNLAALSESATRLQAMTEVEDTPRAGLGEDLRALAMISLGITQYWAAGIEDAERHLGRGIALARQIGRPYLELIGLAHRAAASIYPPLTGAVERARQAVELAEEHGWTDDPALGLACTMLASALEAQGRLEEAEPWVRRAERTLRAGAHPGPGVNLHNARGVLELGRRRYAEALAAFEAAERLSRRLVSPHYSAARAQALLVHALLRLGETGRARRFLVGLDGHQRERPEIRIVSADLALAEGDPNVALATLATALDGQELDAGPVSTHWPAWLGMGLLLRAIALDTLGDGDGAAAAIEHALDLADPDGDLRPFFLYPAPDLLERHARRHRTHASLIAHVQSLLAGTPAPSRTGPQRLVDPLSDAELRVLRYLPTNLTTPEIAREIYVSPNTVKTHVRNLYTKLGTHRRSEAVERARALGLLAPSPVG